MGPSENPVGGAPPTGQRPSGALTAPANSVWEGVLVEAKKEGKGVVAGPPGEAFRQIMQTFERQFPEIELEFTGLSGRDYGP